MRWASARCWPMKKKTMSRRLVVAGAGAPVAHTTANAAAAVRAVVAVAPALAMSRRLLRLKRR
jgi:hypothetical protein